jgi:hypothetical protein
VGLRAEDQRYKVIFQVPSCQGDGCGGVSSKTYI